MTYLLIKFALSAAVIVAISEIARRNSSAAALLASLPLVSVLALVWLYLDTRDATKIAELSSSVFWLVIPSLLLFLALPALLAGRCELLGRAACILRAHRTGLFGHDGAAKTLRNSVLDATRLRAF